MIYIFYFFAAFQIFFGCKSLRGGIDFLNYFKRELSKPKSFYTPFCSVIVPCRGIDADLDENLKRLFLQNYPNYEIIFVVDDKADEAVSVIENLLNEQSEKSLENVRAKIIIAGKAENEGQKVHNLREALTKVSDESEVFVFVDSDARPDRNWLKNLVAPLQNQTLGCATGYRWFIAKTGNFASQMRSVWNASIASALGERANKNFCWGGSTAIRRQVFEKLKVREKWRGTLSDDFALTRILQKENLPIYFVPECLTATIESCGFAEFLEFSTRQMKITRVYAPNLWKASFIGSFLFTAIFWTGILLLFFVSGWHFWLTLASLLIIFALGSAKSHIRLKAVKLVLKDYKKDLDRSILWHNLFWVITPVIFLYNNFTALLSNEIVWRGITYKLVSPDETEILSTGEKF